MRCESSLESCRIKAGNLHFDGAMENQVMYSLNGFNVGNPVTGRLTTRLPVEAVRSLDYSSGRYSPEFGKGSAGTLAIQTTSGDDRFRYSLTNFIPGIETQTGFHIGTWSPRFAISGPIRRGRAWFSETIDAEYNQAVIPDLPAGENRTTRVRGGSMLHGQVNLTPTHLLFVDFLTGYENAPRSGYIGARSAVHIGGSGKHAVVLEHQRSSLLASWLHF